MRRRDAGDSLRDSRGNMAFCNSNHNEVNRIRGIGYYSRRVIYMTNFPESGSEMNYREILGGSTFMAGNSHQINNPSGAVRRE